MNIKKVFRYGVTRLFWAWRFGKFGSRSVLFHPVLVTHPKYMHIGARTVIRDNARIEVILRPGVPCTPRLTIGNDVNIEQGVHIICQGEITIEDEVSITPYCAIVDTEHPFDDPDKPPKIGNRLNDRTDSRTRIGRGSFIGAHSVILPGVDIGRGCVIGAGSVVTQSIPDYCVASGTPARVLRRFDPLARVWHVVKA